MTDDVYTHIYFPPNAKEGILCRIIHGAKADYVDFKDKQIVRIEILMGKLSERKFNSQMELFS
ncbi:MAG TPA: hypothetical protein VHO03_17220 [Ignavibacteriales bacterium]|nr:hypothetical protein [Ignavibacteriales bacterium]